eukprot:Em0048g25a
MQDNECQASELHLVLYMKHLSESTESKAAVKEAARGTMECFVGNNGEGDFPNEGHVVKDSDNCFTVWCTGRTGCDWMMAQLRLQRRQDLFTLLLSLVRPSPDTVLLTIQLAADDMDNIVLALSQKMTILKQSKDLEDLNLTPPLCAPTITIIIVMIIIIIIIIITSPSSSSFPSSSSPSSLS